MLHHLGVLHICGTAEPENRLFGLAVGVGGRQQLPLLNLSYASAWPRLC